jgi:hypothetical protein
MLGLKRRIFLLAVKMLAACHFFLAKKDEKSTRRFFPILPASTKYRATG